MKDKRKKDIKINIYFNPKGETLQKIMERNVAALSRNVKNNR